MAEQLVEVRENYPGGEPLPPTQIEAQYDEEVPATLDGPFLDSDKLPQQYLVTPVDESTGVPLPIYPRGELPPIPRKGQTNTERYGDWHHPFHPRAALVHGTLGQQALRNCRVQWTKYEDHHNGIGYHQTFAGPEVPESELRIFKTVVFAAAGFVGPQAIALSPNGHHSIEELRRWERQRLLAPGVIQIDEYYKVSNFLLDYGARHSIATMNSGLVDELLHSTDLKARARVAGELIACASEEVTGDFKEEFRQAKRERWLPNDRTASAANYVRNLLTVQRDGNRAVDKRTLRLLTAALQTA